MRHLILAILLTTILSSCADKYSIAGNSSMPSLDGRMLYLRADTDCERIGHVCIDSCEVVHGEFNFIGFVDSAMFVELCMDNHRMMPLVLETGNLKIRMDHGGQHVSGGPLNERLYKFFQKKNRMENELWELQQRGIRMMRKGKSPEEVSRKIMPKRHELCKKIEQLETKFIMDNYENVLGPGLFMLLTNQFPSPIITNQIRTILQTAPPVFMSHPFIISYVEATNF